ncbi:hypothetical protein [Pseudaquabacterium pictum]|uniref:hypothetical protein n=1 Tax=Pseudaquabacterium pictum TaxID=2315236 RepID=UPI0012B6A938|nr:hypothetical protein [Rubrivivax pictus]
MAEPISTALFAIAMAGESAVAFNIAAFISTNAALVNFAAVSSCGCLARRPAVRP